MQAVVKTHRGPGGEVMKVPDPTPAEDEVLVRIRASSICGTDVHIWKWNEWAQEHIRKVPMIFGHELSGEVIQVGERVRSLAVGDHVSAETHIVDGTCYQCRTGQDAHLRQRPGPRGRPGRYLRGVRGTCRS